MTVAPSPTAFAVSNRASGQESGRSPDESGALNALRNFFLDLWRKKAPQNLAVELGTGVRHAERFLSGERGMSASRLIRLLQGDHGGKVLGEIMRGSSPRWWRESQAATERADLRRAIRDAERRLKRLNDREAAQ